MIQKIFLLGNPNVGKSVVFSRLTGVHVVSSNYPGTTVEISRGFLREDERAIEVIDLPGTYSLESNAPAEQAAIAMLKSHLSEEIVVVNIIDATNLERNLHLTLHLIEQGFPMVVCLNMCDDCAHRGIEIDVGKLSELLGVPVVATCAITGMGIKQLIEQLPAARVQPPMSRTHQERWVAVGMVIEQVQKLTHRHHRLGELLEDASVKPLSGFLMAAAVLVVCFGIVRVLGEFIIARITDPFFYSVYKPVIEMMGTYLKPDGFWFHLLIGDLVGGTIDFKQSLGLLTTAPYIEIGMVLPYIISFYLALSLLEDIGYLPRLAILMDNVLHRLGLHGYAVIPVLLGYGCNVPGILATRVLESKRERFIASTLISIGVPCVPLQAMIVGLLGAYGGIYVFGVYGVLFVVLIALGAILNKTVHGYSPEFLIEIPPFRFPPLSLLWKKLYVRVAGFLIEAMPVVLAGVLVVNLLLYAGFFDTVTGLFAPIITGLFGLPQGAAVALAIGFIRKDVAVGMLAPLSLSVEQLFIASTLLAVSFPCIATFAVLFKELGFRALMKATLIMVAVTVAVGTLLNILFKLF